MRNEYCFLIDLVSKYENVNKDDIMTKSNSVSCRSRNIIIYILHHYYDMTFKEISQYLNRCPSTISKSYNNFISKSIDKEYIAKIKLKLDDKLKNNF